MLSTKLRDQQMLTDYLGGLTQDALREKYKATKAMVSNGLRQALLQLQEHADYKGTISLDQAGLIKNKTHLLSCLQMPLPKTSITPKAKAFLIEHFGLHYARCAEKIAREWQSSKIGDVHYRDYRHIESIRNWLASEGYLVDDFADTEMIQSAFAQIKKALMSMPLDKTVSAEVTDVRIDNRTAYCSVMITKGEHQANRRLKIELLPAY